MICPQCGTSMPDGSIFCVECGAQLMEAMSPVVSELGDAERAPSAPGESNVLNELYAWAAEFDVEPQGTAAQIQTYADMTAEKGERNRRKPFASQPSAANSGKRRKSRGPEVRHSRFGAMALVVALVLACWAWQAGLLDGLLPSFGGSHGENGKPAEFMDEPQTDDGGSSGGQNGSSVSTSSGENEFGGMSFVPPEGWQGGLNEWGVEYSSYDAGSWASVEIWDTGLRSENDDPESRFEDKISYYESDARYEMISGEVVAIDGCPAVRFERLMRSSYDDSWTYILDMEVLSPDDEWLQVEGMCPDDNEAGKEQIKAFADSLSFS